MPTAAVPPLLDWHQTRRGHGTPTVSVLAGPPGLGLRAWRGWTAARSRSLAVSTAHDPIGCVRVWAGVALSGDPVAAAVGWVRRAAGVEIDVTRTTRFDLGEVARVLPAGAPVAAAAVAILGAAIRGRVRPADVAEELVSRDPVAAVVGLVGLLPDADRPALAVVPPGQADGSAWLIGTLRTLERIAAAVPELPVAVCAPAVVVELVAAGSDRGAALAREGRVDVPAVTAAELARRLTAAGVEPLPPDTAVAALAEHGLAPDVAAAYVAVAQAVRADDPATPSEFRSAHEELLLGLLESDPVTAGLFRPNQPLPFPHGHKTAEADLLAAGRKIVVEVDGGYYHLTQTQYRRDRRKDWLYQRHGYLVLRFLAEDVVDDPTSVLDAVRAAVAWRPPAPARPEVPARE